VSALLQGGAVLCGVLGLLSAAVVLAAERDVRTGLRVLLDFLVAGGVLRLGGDPSWREVASAAALVAVRQLLARS
jgi:hypothetical protein